MIMGSKDSWAGGSLSKKAIREQVTPHKISVVILIQEYFNSKPAEGPRRAPRKSGPSRNAVAGALSPSLANRQARNKTEDVVVEETDKLAIRYRKDFSMLILHLIQCPDMDFKELTNLLESGKYMILPEVLQTFTRIVEGFVRDDLGHFMDLIQNLGRLLIDPINSKPVVNRGSPLGLYLRRVMLYFDKLNFAQTTTLYRSYQRYVTGKEPQGTEKNELYSSSVMAESPPLANDSASNMESVNMDLSSVEPLPSPLVKDVKKMTRLEDEPAIEDAPSLWSRRQTEFFISRQSTLLQNNDSSALPPPQMQNVINQVLKANPDHFEAHFLSYLNCLRVKELEGAIESLYHYFDRTTCTGQDKESKGYRYAALNLAILHFKFGHKAEALSALKEAIFLSHEVNDNICLQHAQSWLYKLTEENKEILMERSISKCSDLGLNFLTSLGLQSFAQFAGTTGGKPALVFEVLMRSDVLNCQFWMMDLMSQSFTHKAALWNLYGKADMAMLSSQLLLQLDTYDSINHGVNPYQGEATCQAICNVANRLTDLGEYELAMVVVEHAKDNFPDSTIWQLTEQILYFTRNLYQGKWQAAHTAVQQLATLDKWEALLREGELCLAKGDSAGALTPVTIVLDGGPSLCPNVRVRALLLAARGSQTAAVSILTAALSIANYHYLDYLTALVAMQLAHVQLQMNLPNQALKLMDQSLLVVLSHGGYYNQASALLLFVQCKVASVATAEAELRNEVIADAIRLLSKVKDNFHHMEAFTKVKEAVYLQCQLANELGCYAERNKFAYEFHQLDEEFPSSIGA